MNTQQIIIIAIILLAVAAIVSYTAYYQSGTSTERYTYDPKRALLENVKVYTNGLEVSGGFTSNSDVTVNSNHTVGGTLTTNGDLVANGDILVNEDSTLVLPRVVTTSDSALIKLYGDPTSAGSVYTDFDLLGHGINIGYNAQVNNGTWVLGNPGRWSSRFTTELGFFKFRIAPPGSNPDGGPVVTIDSNGLIGKSLKSETYILANTDGETYTSGNPFVVSLHGDTGDAHGFGVQTGYTMHLTTTGHRFYTGSTAAGPGTSTMLLNADELSLAAGVKLNCFSGFHVEGPLSNFDQGGGFQMKLQQVGSTYRVVYDNSTRKDKMNIMRAEQGDPLAILKLEPVFYERKSNPGVVDFGVIAEQADDIGIGHLCMYADKQCAKNFKCTCGATGTCLQNFNYEKMPLLLLELVKQQERRIRRLEATCA